MVHRFLRLVVPSLFVGSLVAVPRGPHTSRPALECRVDTERSSGLVTKTGRRVSLMPSSVAWNGKQLAVLGEPTMLTGDASVQTNPQSEISFGLGVISDTLGSSTLIGYPKAHPHALRPQVVAGPGDSWTVLFFDRVFTDANRIGVDSAELWIGTYRHGVWHDLRRVHTLRDANISPTFTSRFVRRATELGFAYAFNQSLGARSGTRSKRGIVVLRGSGDKMRVDTLVPEGPGFYLALLARPNATAWDLLAQAPAYDSTQHFRSESLVRAKLEEIHSPLSVVSASENRTYAYALIWLRSGRNSLALWLSESPSRRTTLRARPLTEAQSVESVIAGDVSRYSIAPFGATRAFVVHAVDADTGRLQYVFVDDRGRTEGAGRLAIRDNGPTIASVAVADGAVMIVSNARSRTQPFGPPITTLTSLQGHCGDQ